MAVLKLSGSVGEGGNNDPADVEKVVARFVELGYTWVSGITKGNASKLIKTIKLFQSTCKGKGQANNGDGKISLHGNTHKWLAAKNAPAWVKIYGQAGLGWTTTTRLEPSDYKESNGGYGTSWLLERINWAGFTYSSRAVFSVSDAPPLWVRECSPAEGGDAYGHKSHETGIDMDIRLPLLPPQTNKWTQLKAHNYTELFHYEAAIVQLESIRATMDPKNVFFNDKRFIGKGLSTHEANHSEHYHIRIKPPTRIEGVIS
jgi:hypothetical protein